MGMGFAAVKAIERLLERLVLGFGMVMLGMVGFAVEKRVDLMLVMGNRRSRGRNGYMTVIVIVIPIEGGRVVKRDARLSAEYLMFFDQ